MSPGQKISQGSGAEASASPDFNALSDIIDVCLHINRQSSPYTIQNVLINIQLKELSVRLEVVKNIYSRDTQKDTGMTKALDMFSDLVNQLCEMFPSLKSGIMETHDSFLKRR